MKTAYFDCLSGISGDLILGALLDAGIPEELFRKELSLLNMDEFFEMKIYKKKKGFLTATKVDIIPKEETKHRHLKDIYLIIDKSNLKNTVKEKTKKIFHTLAEGEAKIHNEPIYHVHFHEVGAVDTIIDITGSVIALDILGIEKVYSSPLPMGGGFVTCSHGKIPIPAPATVEILKNKAPMYKDEREGELVTPTGAAVIATIAEKFCSMPPMTISSIGYGSGSYDSDTDYLRIFTGDISETKEISNIMIETSIDDMNPQIYDYVINKLFSAGALDVTIAPIFMKKQRPAIILSVLIEPEIEKKVRDILFKETTTIGYRKYEVKKIMMERQEEKIVTPLGEVRVKKASYENTLRSNPEFDDCKKIAENSGRPLKDIIKYIERHIDEKPGE